MFEKRDTGLAVVGPINFSARLKNPYATIADAEAQAVAVAFLCDAFFRDAKQIPETVQTTVYSDRKGVVDAIAEFRADDGLETAVQGASRHSMRWLQSVSSPTRTFG